MLMRRFTLTVLTLLLASARAAAHEPTEVVLTPESEPRPVSQEQGITGAVHRQHLGKIVFSTQEIPVQPSAAAFRSRFGAKDPIYGRVFVNRSIKNTPLYLGEDKIASTAPSWEVRLFVDGKNQAVKFGSLFRRPARQEPGDTWCTWRLEPRPEQITSNTAYPGIVEGFNQVVAKLTPGKHLLRFEVWVIEGQFSSRGPIAAGELTYTRGKGDKVTLGRLPKNFLRGREEAEAVAQMKKALVGKGIAKGPSEILRVVASSRWSEGVFTDTKKTYRKITGTVLWRDSDGDGVCRYTSYNFVKVQQGRLWTPLSFSGHCNGCAEGQAECR